MKYHFYNKSKPESSVSSLQLRTFIKAHDMSLKSERSGKQNSQPPLLSNQKRINEIKQIYNYNSNIHHNNNYLSKDSSYHSSLQSRQLSKAYYPSLNSQLDGHTRKASVPSAGIRSNLTIKNIAGSNNVVVVGCNNDNNNAIYQGNPLNRSINMLSKMNKGEELVKRLKPQPQNQVYLIKNFNNMNNINNHNNALKSERNELSKSSVTPDTAKNINNINYSPSLNKISKPKTGNKTASLKSNVLMPNRNGHLNSAINLNYNTHDARINLSGNNNSNVKNNNLNNLNNNNYMINNPINNNPYDFKSLNKQTNSHLSSTLKNPESIPSYRSNNNNNKAISNYAPIFNPSARSVKEFAFKEEKNEEHRNSMEDFCRIVDKFMNDPSKGFFSLYDGHGGSELVKYVRDRMPEVLSKFLTETGNNIDKSLTSSFQKIDNELKLMSESQNVGTTACVVLFLIENDIIKGSKRVFYCANVGDTRAVLVTSNEAKRISYDHKCIDLDEVARIKSVGGIVFNGRVFGQLALSRALGDHAMKKYGVVPTPHIYKHTITERDKYIVMCSDGVWDVVEDEDVFDMAAECSNADQLSNEVVKRAVSRGSRDNISCVVVKIN